MKKLRNQIQMREMKYQNIYQYMLHFLYIIAFFLLFTCNFTVVHAAASETGVTRADWLQKLVTTFDMTVDEDNYPDDYFSDLRSDSAYYRDIMVATEFGVVDIEAGQNVEPEKKVTREFAAHTLNYCLGYQLNDGIEYSFSDAANCEYPADAQIAVERNWIGLVNGKFVPAQEITSAEAAQMLQDAAQVLETAKVDEAAESNYKFADDVVVVPKGTEVSIDENDIVTINGTANMNIKAGDTFVVYPADLPCLFKANMISRSGNSMIITTSEADEETAIVSIRSEGVADVDLSQFESAENVNTMYIETQQQARAASSTYGIQVTKDSIIADTTIPLGKGCSIKLAVNLSDLRIPHKIDSLNRYYFVTVEGNLSVTGTLSANLLDMGGVSKSITLGQLRIAGVGVINVTAEISAEGKIIVSYKGGFRAGFQSSQGDFRLISSFNKKSFTSTVEAKASIGLKAAAEVDLLLAKGSIYIETGINVKMVSDTYNDGKLPATCTQIEGWLAAKAGARATLGLGIWKRSYSKEYDIFTAKNSPVRLTYHYEDRKQVIPCTRGKDYSYFTNSLSRYGSSCYGDGSSTGYDAEWKPYTIYTYDLDKDGNATITSYKGNVGVLIIPDTLDGYTVVGIGNGAFRNSILQIVTIPDTVTVIGKEAFADSINLQSVEIGNSVTKIGDNAFRKDNKLIKIVIPDSVTEMGSGVFAECTELREVILSKSLQTMGVFAFYDCDQLTAIEIPKSLENTKDGYYPEYVYGFVNGPFYACDGLKSITFEKGTTKIANGLFTSCPGLETITIPNTVTVIGDNSFGDCVNLQSVKIGSSVTKIEKNAFIRDKMLTEIVIPDSVIEIESGVFAECTGLREVTLSKSLQTMGVFAFYDCDQLTAVEIPKSLESTKDGYYPEYVYGYVYGPFYDCDGLKTITFEKGIPQIANGLFASCPGIETITIPDTVTVIGDGSFSDCMNLQNAQIGNSVIKIENNAFKKSKKLTEITIPDSVTEIGSGVFAECEALSRVKLSKGLKTIATFAFYDCDQITELEVPKSLDETRDAYYPEYHYGYVNGPFYGCDGLKSVTFEKGTTKIANGLFAYCTGLENITIPDTVEKIENRVFLMCTQLKKDEMTDSVKSFGDALFYGCSSLTDICLSKELLEIPNEAFKDCSALQTLELSDTISRIGASAFRNSGVKNIEIPSNVTNIEDNAFENSGVEEFVIKDAETRISYGAFRNCAALKIVDLGQKIISIRNYAFENCDLLTDITIPDSVTEIGEYTFANSERLKNVTLGTGITNIPNHAFFECPSLESLILPYRVTEIQSEAFANCTGLKELTIPRATTTIADTILSYPQKMTIYGVTGTTAETYANDKNITFVGREIHAENVALDQTELTLHNGKSARLTLSITPIDFTDEVTWKSSDTNVVTVTDAGVVRTKGTGSATIKVNVGAKSASCNVTVLQPVTWIDLSDDSLEMDAMETQTLTADAYPDDAADKNITWSSSDEKIVTVDQNGLVTAVAKGTATITVTAQDGSGTTATCNVTVRNNAHVVKLLRELESEHNYTNGCSDFWIYTRPGAESLMVTFNEKTEVEDGFDFLYIYTGDGTEVGKYTGVELSGKTIKVAGDTVRIQLFSDDGGNAWGFKVDRITDGFGQPLRYPQTVTGTASYTKLVGDPAFRLDVKIKEGNGTISYSSDNEAVAAVSEDGLVTIKGKGTAIITVTASETEDYEKGVLQIRIEVSEKNDPNGTGDSQDFDNPQTEKPSTGQEANRHNTVKVTRIKIRSSLSNKIAAGKKVKLIADVFPSNASNKKIKWTSSNPKIASVNASGVVTVKKKTGGKSVTIIASAADGSNIKAKYKITSMKGIVKKISISGKKTVKAGKTLKLKAKATSTKKANKKLKWTSSNTKYATVNSSGKVNALKKGKGKKVKITAMATDGSGKKKSVTIKIK